MDTWEFSTFILHELTKIVIIIMVILSRLVHMGFQWTVPPIVYGTVGYDGQQDSRLL